MLFVSRLELKSGGLWISEKLTFPSCGVRLLRLLEHRDAWGLKATGRVLEEGKRMNAARGPCVLTDLMLDLPIGGPS